MRLVLCFGAIVFKHIHNLCFLYSNDRIVNHCAIHNLIDMFYGHRQVVGLYQIGYVGALFLLCFLVNGNKLQLTFIPLVVTIYIAEENLAIASLFQVSYFEVSTNISAHFFNDCIFSFCETQCIHNIAFRNFFLRAIVNGFLITYLGFKPSCSPTSHIFLLLLLVTFHRLIATCNDDATFCWLP